MKFFVVCCFLCIQCVVICYCLDDLIFELLMLFWWLCLFGVILFWCWLLWCKLELICGVCLCLVLQDFGLIFIKFGQIFFICCDLLFDDIVNELVWLQDKVLFFLLELVVKCIEEQLGVKIEQVFVCFECELLVFVLVVQVYVVCLKSGEEVVVKVIWLNLELVICFDIVWLFIFVCFVEWVFSEVWCLYLVEVVSDYEKIIVDEFDLFCEVVNVLQL